MCILYVNENVRIKPYIHGGAQERNMRAGTENLYGIVGFAKALELATTHYEEHSAAILAIKQYMAEQLRKNINGITFNGDTFGKSLYTVLNVSFPKTEKSEMILFNLNINNICTSGGSACTNKIAVRFSFSKNNTKEEIDIVIEKLKELV